MMNEEKNNQTIDLTILLPTYNESTTIEKMLDAITTIIPPKINTEILVIDDDENTRDLLSRMLKEGGWNPKTAKDGKDGLNQLKEEPALIVLDLEMPRMDGFEFLNTYVETVEKENRCPILVYTGKDLTDTQRELLENNVVGLVRKDEVSMDELSAIVQDIYSKDKAEV